MKIQHRLVMPGGEIIHVSPEEWADASLNRWAGIDPDERVVTWDGGSAKTATIPVFTRQEIMERLSLRTTIDDIAESRVVEAIERGMKRHQSPTYHLQMMTGATYTVCVDRISEFQEKYERLVRFARDAKHYQFAAF